MFLEKLEIQGFKSFARKNILLFPKPQGKKRGLTAIVGPNGSGKSNIADAVRWVLGEQSMKLLRGKKSEDVIFSGSDKKSRLSLAEVSLYFNNEDRQFPLDYTQVVLTRRLYRSGESEYLINNNRTRLADIQILLAKANFGQKTYSVIGQGTVESFLNTSLAERKEFFDEATGVKQYQIKRDNSLNKLRQSYKNLTQAKMLLAEIEPRLRSLTRQVNKLRRREQLAAELKQSALLYYAYHWQKRAKAFNSCNEQVLELTDKLAKQKQELKRLEQVHNQIKSHRRLSEEIARWQEQALKWQKKKDQAVRELAQEEIKQEISLASASPANISWLKNKEQELKKEETELTKSLSALTAEIKASEQEQKIQSQKVKGLSEQLDLAQKKIASLTQAQPEKQWQLIGERLLAVLKKIKATEQEPDLKKIKQLLAEIKTEIKRLSRLVPKPSPAEDWQFYQTQIQNLHRQREQALSRLNQIKLNLMASQEKKKMLAIKKGQLAEEIAAIKEKLVPKNRPTSQIQEQASKKTKALQSLIVQADEQLNILQNKIQQLSQEAEAREKELVAQQKKIQAKQEEVSQLAWQLNEVKIKAAKEETRLENLENEIRKNQLDFKAVKNFAPVQEIEAEKLEAKIASLRRQLELIGGIDPAIEKEYSETKERFEFLTAQVDDLTKAIAALEKIIKELDQVIKEKFDRQFKIIAKKFDQYFRLLFGGGTAKIIKIKEERPPAGQKDEENNLNIEEANLKQIKFLQKHNATGLAGIEIQATPPGKKIHSIAMLSGGERALVAIALICAIISANPAPFVVLDEVDAALDEANSQRLAKILAELSHYTQFIVITHNRATMQQADVLYGVTMGADGVSQLLSVKLDQAQKISADNN